MPSSAARCMISLNWALTQHAEVQVAAHVHVAEAKARGEAGMGALAVEVVVEPGARQRGTPPSPVQSMTTGAVSANRPCLLSKITPTTVSSRTIAATTQQCMSVCTFDSRTMSLVTSFSTSGSTVGDQCTVSRKAAVRTCQ